MENRGNVKTSTYHGVIDTTGCPIEKPTIGDLPTFVRDFTNKDFDAIIKIANNLLKDDWFVNNWGDGSNDAPIRAALDMAIFIANESIYQSKIDANTYNLLLNDLADLKYDTFSDTMLPEKKSKTDKTASISVMNMVKMASDIRSTHPVRSFSILKKLGTLTESNTKPIKPCKMRKASFTDFDLAW